jgi:hypothetical protein
MIEENSSMLSEEKDAILSWVQDPDLLVEIIQQNRELLRPQESENDKLDVLSNIAQYPSNSHLSFLKNLLKNNDQEYNLNNVRTCITHIENSHNWVKEVFEQLSTMSRADLRNNKEEFNDLFTIVNGRNAKMSTQEILDSRGVHI